MAAAKKPQRIIQAALARIIRKPMSETFVEGAAFWATVVTAVLTALAAASGLLAWYFSTVSGDNKDAALKRFQDQSKQAIAESKARAEEAKSHSDEANARAMEASKTAESFRLDIAKAQEQAAKSNEIAERERLARIQLEARMAPRILTSDQQQTFARALSPYLGKIVLDLYVLGPTGESARFSQTVASALATSGCIVRQWTVTGTASATGLLVSTRQGADASVSQAASLLLELFQRAGIDAGPMEPFDGPLPLSGMVNGPTVAPNDVAPLRIIIGNKP